MEIVTGYFISRAPAIETARFLERNGFRIEVLGHQNQEDFRERQVAAGIDDDLDVPYYGLMGINTATSGINGFLIAGSGPLIAARPVVSLVNGGLGGDIRQMMIDWGVSRDIEHEIKTVIDSGRSVVMVECDTRDKAFVRETLEKHGAQNIHI
ncbi:MAG: hypothetical protein K0R50_4927 [Eubacterium sp.]|jgi:hypothetical protein|nr:hypothetical protein [Eubacterium sp.]